MLGYICHKWNNFPLLFIHLMGCKNIIYTYKDKNGGKYSCYYSDT